MPRSRAPGCGAEQLLGMACADRPRPAANGLTLATTYGSGMRGSFEELLREADQQPVVGWDFSRLGNRRTSKPLPWDYEAMLLGHARRSPDLLDLGTGGGEFLAALEHRPGRTVATEAWPPNVEVATTRLHPLGITVVAVEAAPDNNQQIGVPTPRLPFPNGSFSLVANRHASYVPSEVARVLAPAGIFLTQQVGNDYGEFYDALGLPRPHVRPWNLDLAREQLERAGLLISNGGDGADATTFADIGAFAWFLKAIPWVIENFSVEKYRPQLARLHRRLEEDGPLTLQQPAFWLEAIDPA